MKTLVISNNSKLQSEIADLCAARTPSVAIISVHGKLLDATERMAAEKPDLVIVDAVHANAGEIGILERFSAQFPKTAFMLLTPDQSPDFLIRAMRAGVREVLSIPIEHKTFNDALERIALKASSIVRQGKVISFISCKGGSGATFLATNFGYALSSLGGKKVLLIDLNQQFGDAALYVSDKKPAITLSDVCVQIDRLDAAFLESCLVSVSSNFGILAASDDPTRSVDITPEHIDMILHLARNYYDYIVVDTGRQIDTVTIRALDNADVIYPVLQLALPYIRDGRRLLDIFRSLGYPRNKTRLIVNRCENDGKLRLSDLESVLGDSASYAIPNSYAAVSDSVNQGVPILQLARNNAVSKSLVGMVSDTVGMGIREDKGILSRFFNRGAPAEA